MATKLQMMQMKAFRKLKWLLMATLLFGGTVKAHVYWDPVDGDDTKSGATYANRVKTFAKAKEKVIAQIASGSNDGKPWVLLCNTCTISGNTSWDGDTGTAGWNVHIKRLTTSHKFTGRMVTVNEGKKLTLQNIEFDGRGNDSGAPYINDCGPIIALMKGATLTMNEGTVLGHNHRFNGSGNTETYNGGGVSGGSGTHMVMNGGRITDCKTNNDGGGVYLSSSEAASTSQASTFIMNDGEIDNCSAVRLGGGIFVSGRKTRANTYYATATFIKGQIHDNDATGKTYDDNVGRGGGANFGYTHVYINPVQDSDFQAYNNHAKRYGAALNFNNKASLEISHGLIYNNLAGEEGNGVPVGSTGLFAGSGAAGIHLTGGATLNMTGGKLYGNQAQWGAAIHASYEGTLEIMGGEIYNNVAYYQGGAINVHTNTNLSFPKGSTVHIHHNKAGRGGAICVDGANLTIVDADIHDNIAADTLKYLLEIPEIPEEVAISLGNGGAICELMQHLGNSSTMAPANFYMFGGQVYNNKATNNGGAMFSLRNTMYPLITNPEVVIKNGVMYDNEATNGSGGGIYADDGTIFIMTADTIMEGGVISEITTGSIYSNTAGQSGGGIYMTNALFTMSAGSFNNNSAAQNGGGFFITGDNCEVTIEGGEIRDNTANNKGGGFAVIGGDVTIEEEKSAYPTSISNNTAPQGGGLYVSDGSVTVSDSDIIGNNTTAGHGGAFLIDNGSLTVSHTNITGNKAHNGNGGGAYVGNGNIVFNAGTTVTGNTAKNGGGICVDGGVISYNDGIITGNKATGNGGGIYVNAGSLSDTIFFRGGLVSNDTAVNGGGIYVNAGTLDFGSGTFSHNYASGNGGGIYVKPGAQVLLSGNAMITKNHVPETLGEAVGRGGGIYLGGQLKVGRNAGDPQGTHSLKVEDNYMGIEANNILNNIYLPTNDNVIELLSDLRNSSTKVGFSVNNGFRKVVYHNGDAINDEDASWLHGLLTEGGSQGLTGVIFDDSRKYMAVHVLINDQTFDHNYIYLWGCWISAVNEDPETHQETYPLPTGVAHHYTIDDTNGTWHIYTKEGLAWFSSYVNGLNAYSSSYSENINGAAKAVMERDVDMSDFLWVPLGSAQSFDPTGHNPTSAIFADGHKFKGQFNGNGHVISGLDCRYINSIHHYGLFGEVIGSAVITNVNVRDYNYDCSQETLAGYIMGGIAGSVSGSSVVSNCVAHGVMKSPESTLSRLGGIVGILNGAEMHSCIGQPDMSGKAGFMGGLVGETVGSSRILNSFANAKLTPTVATDTIGGLVGLNTGTVENCYARLRGTVPTEAQAKFGWLAGSNKAGGEIHYSYARKDGSEAVTYYASNKGQLYGCGYYDNNATAPYSYRHRDSQVTIADGSVNNGSEDNPHKPAEYDPAVVNPDVIAAGESDKQLLLWLNHWVGTSATYAKWQRPTTEAINGDYPVLLLPATDAVACTGNADGSEKDGFLHYGQVNDLLSGYTQATQAVWLYKKKDGLAGNSTSNARLYIADKGFDGKPVTVIPNGTVDAYVGVMLDNSAGKKGANPTFGDGTPDYTDWHMFSSPLTSAPVGINYTNETQYAHSYGHPTGMPYWRFYPEDNANHGYFPSHRYGEEYPANDASLLEGNYYDEWDFYTYYEPEYHWINFKRNSNSHWHENATDAQIHYHAYSGAPEGNETTLVQGKGYLLATREQTFLQRQGTLTDGEVTIPATYSGAYSPGYNFLGNPYLAYLDFDEFARFNSGADSLWSDYSLAGYGIIDEDEYTADNGGYIYYATGASANPMLAPRYIAPHQGFMVHLTAQPAHPATFTTGTIAGQPDMRSLVGDDGEFRGEERPAYPLVNMLAYDDNGNRSIATVELGRPDRGGLQLMRELKGAKCHVYCRYEDEDWSVVFTQPGLSEAAIRFEALEDGEFTMKWDTQNGDFHYLHLVDNQTGADVDCLATDEYRFTATTEDYRSRFRLVFGYTGIEEPEAGEAGGNTFAFQSGDELVVTGEGSLTMFDVTGRAVMSAETYGVQTAAPLPKVAAGVYLLRLETANGTKVQKIVIK